MHSKIGLRDIKIIIIFRWIYLILLISAWSCWRVHYHGFQRRLGGSWNIPSPTKAPSFSSDFRNVTHYLTYFTPLVEFSGEVGELQWIKACLDTSALESAPLSQQGTDACFVIGVETRVHIFRPVHCVHCLYWKLDAFYCDWIKLCRKYFPAFQSHWWFCGLQYSLKIAGHFQNVNHGTNSVVLISSNHTSREEQ